MIRICPNTILSNCATIVLAVCAVQFSAFGQATPVADLGIGEPVLIRFDDDSVTASRTTAAIPLVAPAPPLIPPIISTYYLEDADGDAIADSLGARLDEAYFVLQQANSPKSEIQALAALDEDVDVELVFSRPIEQAQINAFLGLGGEIRYIYKAVSYGWYGTIALAQVDYIPSACGASLVLVEELMEASLNMRLATQTGRVRPVWAAGFAGGTGYDGDPSIRIAIIDTGVDGGHTDVTGREAFWFDYTADTEPTSKDIIGHGSHVASIAFGTGASLGVGTTLNFTQDGDLSGVPNGSFFPNGFDFPSLTTDWTVIAHWVQGNGPQSTNLFGGHTPKGSLSFSADFGGSITTGQGWLASGFAMSSVNAYTPILTSNRRMQNFVTLNTLTNYSAVGDGFNTLRGVAPASHWVGAKVFTNAGSGTSGTIGAAIDDMVVKRITHNIKIMNLSLGFPGSPGIETTTRQKINTAALNGILPVISAGNDGPTSASSGEVGDPGRAAMALTVGAANDLNQLTDYTSHGFGTPGSTAGQEEDFKPDVLAPGGSIYYSMIMAMDTNDADAPTSTSFLADFVANDYLNIMGTSMASPFAAGCAALVIDALQITGNLNGGSWDFTSSNDVRRVKMLLTATATETNAAREAGTGTTPGTDPTLQRASGGPLGFPAGKDPYEGYGILNVDAAIEGGTLSYSIGAAGVETFGSGDFDRRAWARNISMTASIGFDLNLTVPGGGDYDMYLYSFSPSASGTPVMLASSTNAGDGVSETVSHVPVSTELALLVIKRVSGSGQFTLGSVLHMFNGAPQEYTFALQPNGDVQVTDTVIARDGVNTILAGTTTVKFAALDYNFFPGTNGADDLRGIGTIEDDAALLNNRDLMLGFDGNDTIRGINGDDVIFGGNGADVLKGDNGDDYLQGGPGNDTLHTGIGNDEAQGGAGADLIVLAGASDTLDTVNGGADLGDKLLLANGYGSYTMTSTNGFEAFVGGDGADSIDWSSATSAVSMRGNSGNDTLLGGSGNDIIHSGSGNDFLRGNGGNDLIVVADPANPSNDFDGGAGTDHLLLANGYGSFTMNTPQGFENFTGGDGADTIDWSSATGRVVMRGNSGADVLTSGSGNDLITGGPGNDTLSAGGGDDVMYGDAGVNQMTGGGGVDRLNGNSGDTAHFSASPVAPRYVVNILGSYTVVTDTESTDGMDIVRPPDMTLSN